IQRSARGQIMAKREGGAKKSLSEIVAGLEELLADMSHKQILAMAVGAGDGGGDGDGDGDAGWAGGDDPCEHGVAEQMAERLDDPILQQRPAGLRQIYRGAAEDSSGRNGRDVYRAYRRGIGGCGDAEGNGDLPAAGYHTREVRRGEEGEIESERHLTRGL